MSKHPNKLEDDDPSLGWLDFCDEVTKYEAERSDVMMKLFLLERREGAPHYGECLGILIRAINRNSARRHARKHVKDKDPEIWLDAKATTCKWIKEAGPEVIILTANGSD